MTPARNDIKVLMYHRVTDDPCIAPLAMDWCVRTSAFRKQLELLDRLGFTSITFNDYRLHLAGELNLPKKPVILSFDDGYEDTFEIAFPLMEEFGMKGVVFVLGDRTISHNMWDLPDGLAKIRLMSDKQILEMHTAGHEIGSHSMSHARLTQLPRSSAWDEISRSRMLLEMLLNAPIKTFAYPYGLVNQTLKNMVADAGYSLACSTYTGPGKFGVDPFELRRMTVTGSVNSIGFSFRMLTPYTRYEWLKRKVKNLLVSPLRAGRTPVPAPDAGVDRPVDIAPKELS
jgi:peptidoglycan/xylan/chitin deacetylase (PgdA/CDA1 family)